MAIFRNVHITFWTDPKIVDDFTPEDKYFYLYLLTNPHTNLCGCYEVSFKQMSDELGYNKETVEKLIIRFHEVHKILDYSKETKEMLLYNWSKYNWTKSPKFQAALLKEIPKVKHPAFSDFLNGILNGDTVSIPYLYGMDTTDSDTDTDIISDTDNKKSVKRKASRKAFVPPTLEEIKEYCKSRNNDVDPKKFFDYFTASNWVDSKGQPVLNWKQKVITWEGTRKDGVNNGTAASNIGKAERIGTYL